MPELEKFARKPDEKEAKGLDMLRTRVSRVGFVVLVVGILCVCVGSWLIYQQYPGDPENYFWPSFWASAFFDHKHYIPHLGWHGFDGFTTYFVSIGFWFTALGLGMTFLLDPVTRWIKRGE
jgi:hypothetical protein